MDLPTRVAIMGMISGFSSDHADDITATPIKWETLKCVLRGVYFSSLEIEKKKGLYNGLHTWGDS